MPGQDSSRLSERRRTNYPIYYRDLDRLDKLFPEQSAPGCPLNQEGILGNDFLGPIVVETGAQNALCPDAG